MMASTMPDRVPALTGVRGIAASWVVLFHGRALLDRVGILPGLASSRLAASGYLAVDLFFILSGFILARSHAKRLDKASFGAFAGAFYLNRAFRVLPLNGVCLCFLLIVATLLGPAGWPTPTGSAGSFVAALLLVQNWGLGLPTSWNIPAWSLSAECLAYVGFPIALLAVARHLGRAGAVVAYILCIVLLVAIMAVYGEGSLAHTWLLGLPRCILQFLAGMALWRWSVSRPAWSPRADVLLVAGASMLVVAIALPSAELLAPIAFSAMILACAGGRGAGRGRLTDAMLGNPAVEFIGEISFSLYLIHFVMLGLFEYWAKLPAITDASRTTQTIFIVAALASIYLTAGLLWRFVEGPGQRAGRRAESRWLGGNPARA